MNGSFLLPERLQKTAELLFCQFIIHCGLKRTELVAPGIDADARFLKAQKLVDMLCAGVFEICVEDDL